MASAYSKLATCSSLLAMAQVITYPKTATDRSMASPIFYHEMTAPKTC